jgi:hypothetical protein
MFATRAHAPRGIDTARLDRIADVGRHESVVTNKVITNATTVTKAAVTLQP